MSRDIVDNWDVSRYCRQVESVATVLTVNETNITCLLNMTDNSHIHTLAPFRSVSPSFDSPTIAHDLRY